MTFPLDIRTELNLGGAWEDISADVYVRDQTVISRGRRDLGSSADPSSLSLTLNNRGGKYVPRNAASPLYGLIGRNTPIRLSVPGTGPYLQMDGDPAKYAFTPDAPTLNVSADLDVRAELAPDWYGPANQMLMGKWDPATDARSWALRLVRGELWFHYSTDGTRAGSWGYFRRLPVMPQRAAVRATFTASNEDGDREFRFYWAGSLDGPWTQLGGASVAAGPGPIHAGTAPLSIAPTEVVSAANPRVPFVGRGYRFEVRDGIDGPVVASPDFTAQADGVTAFTDSAGLPWSLAGGAEIRDREDRFIGEVSSWPMKWTTDGADIWSPLQASGLLRRLGQGQKPIDSTLRRRIPSGDPVAYWPFEDAAQTTHAYSPLPGVNPAAVTGMDFAALDSLVSSAPLPRLLKSGSLSAQIPQFDSDEWQVELVYNADDKAPADYAELFSLSSPDGTVRRWRVELKEGLGHVQGFDASGSEVTGFLVAVGDDIFHGWVRLRLWAYQDGGTVHYRINWQDVGGDSGGLSGSYTGTLGRLTYVTADWGPLTEGWGFGHLTVMDTANDPIMTGSDDAFHGETAWNRMLRLATEERLPLSLIPGEIGTARVGYQRRDTILGLLDLAAQADGGRLSEDPRRVGLVYRGRSHHYTQDPALVLSYTEPGLGPDLEPVDDDSAVRNDVTVTRDGGSSGRAFLAVGPLSVQPPPAGVGLYDEAVTLSLAYDNQPEPVAAWRLHLGTFDGARYPVVSLVLHKPGAGVHVPALLGLREGDLIRLTDLPPWLSSGDVDLIVEGWTETLDLYRWTVEFNCSPGGPWNLATVDHPTYGRADADGSELAAAVGEADTSLSVTGSLPWTTDPADFPLDVSVGGEVMTVSAVAGASVPQTFTVQRAVNGVTKSHAAGSPVGLALPSVASL